MKREITLAQALTVLLTNNVPGQNISYTISFDEVSRYIKFGKGYNPFYRQTTWTISSMGRIVSFENSNVDEFLTTLFNDDYIGIRAGQKKFHVWEVVNDEK